MDFCPDYDWGTSYKKWEISFRTAENPLVYCCKYGITERYLEDSLKKTNIEVF